MTDVGGHNCASEDPLAVAGCHAIVPCGPGLGVEGASWTSLREATTGRYADFMLPNAHNRRIIGLVRLLQRCRRARVSPDTSAGMPKPTPMQTMLASRRTMRVTSPSTQSYSFPDMTGPDRHSPYPQYGHSRHILSLYCQRARRRTMLHNMTLDLAKSLRLLPVKVEVWFRHLETLATL